MGHDAPERGRHERWAEFGAVGNGVAVVLIRAIVEADSHALREMGRETWRDSYGARPGPRAYAAIAASLGGEAVRSMIANFGGPAALSLWTPKRLWEVSASPSAGRPDATDDLRQLPAVGQNDRDDTACFSMPSRRAEQSESVQKLCASSRCWCAASSRRLEMPRYFFDVHKDGNELQDEEGSDLANDRMAEGEAIGILQDMTRSTSFGGDQGTIQAHVRNAAGHVIFKAKIELTTERVETA